MIFLKKPFCLSRLTNFLLLIPKSYRHALRVQARNKSRFFLMAAHAKSQHAPNRVVGSKIYKIEKRVALRSSVQKANQARPKWNLRSFPSEMEIF